MIQVHHVKIEKDMDIMFIILAVMLMIIGTEDIRMIYYSPNTQSMNRKNGYPLERNIFMRQKAIIPRHRRYSSEYQHHIMTVTIITEGIAFQVIRKENIGISLALREDSSQQPEGHHPQNNSKCYIKFFWYRFKLYLRIM